jgi:hypothetical protein
MRVVNRICPELELANCAGVLQSFAVAGDDHNDCASGDWRPHRVADREGRRIRAVKEGRQW